MNPSLLSHVAFFKLDDSEGGKWFNTLNKRKVSYSLWDKDQQAIVLDGVDDAISDAAGVSLRVSLSEVETLEQLRRQLLSLLGRLQ